MQRRKLLRRIFRISLGSSPLAVWLQPVAAQTAPAAVPASGAQSVGAQAATSSIGTVEFVSGNVTVRRSGTPLSAQEGAPLQAGDLIEASRGAELHARFDDGGYLAVRSGSSVRIDQYVAQGEATDTAAFTLFRGALRSVTGWIGKIGGPQQYKITSGTTTIGVRGTDHEVVLVQDSMARADLEAGLHNRVNEGATTITNERGKVDVEQGAAGFAPRTGGTPQLHARIPGFFNRLRTANDIRVVEHRQALRGFMETKLRERGKLVPGQNFDQFLARHPRVGAAGGPVRPGPVGTEGRPANRAAGQSTTGSSGATPVSPQSSQQERRESRRAELLKRKQEQEQGENRQSAQERRAARRRE
jgi:hypothetical protein